jgi:hypothetical protein
MEKKNKMKRNNVFMSMPVHHSTSGKGLHLEIDPIEIKKDEVKIEMNDCDMRIQPIKFKVKGDNVRLPKQNITIGHAEMSIEMCGLEMSKNATDNIMKLWQIVGNGLFGLIQSNSETDKEEDQENVEKSETEKTNDDFDPIQE